MAYLTEKFQRQADLRRRQLQPIMQAVERCDARRHLWRPRCMNLRRRRAVHLGGTVRTVCHRQPVLRLVSATARSRSSTLRRRLRSAQHQPPPPLLLLLPPPVLRCRRSPPDRHLESTSESTTILTISSTSISSTSTSTSPFSSTCNTINEVQVSRYLAKPTSFQFLS